MNSEVKTWLITGVSGGLGRALALEAARNGHIVIGTLRKEEQLLAFNNLVAGKTFGLQLDVNEAEGIEEKIAKLVAEHKNIDVLVNNAGYGLFGAIEEVSMEEARQQMETNFFGALAMTKAVLPYMRKQRSGSIIQISSMAGFRSNPGMGLYNASKFALEGFSEALALEVENLNIKVTIVEPGPFRTNWAGGSSARAATVIEDYADTAGARIATVTGYSGQQPGDPVKAARAIVSVVEAENPPLRLALGTVAMEAIRTKLESVKKNLSDWEELSRDTDFDD